MPAFIVNRILVPMINEASYALYEGVGNGTSIDTAMKRGANRPPTPPRPRRRGASVPGGAVGRGAAAHHAPRSLY